MEEFKPYAKYGVAELLAVHDIKAKVLEIKYVEDIDELIDVVLACSDFELAWKSQIEPLVCDASMRRMDAAYGLLNSKRLFKK